MHCFWPGLFEITKSLHLSNLDFLLKLVFSYSGVSIGKSIFHCHFLVYLSPPCLPRSIPFFRNPNLFELRTAHERFESLRNAKPPFWFWQTEISRKCVGVPEKS